MLELKQKFHAFCTLGSPHLGVLNSDTHIKLGVWATEALYESVSINQMRLADSTEIENTFMYHLSQQEGLEYFEHIYFLASPQDR